LGESRGMPDEQMRALLEHGEEQGCLNLSQFSEFVQEHELDEGQLAHLYEELEARHIELTDDCARNETETDSTFVNGDLAIATTDALQLFLNEAAKWPLLTAEEEVELAKRLGRIPTEQEVERRAKLPLKQVREVRQIARAVTSLDKPIGAENEGSFGELVPADQETPEEEVTYSLQEEALRQAVDELPERERKIVKLRYGLNGDRDPKSLDAIGRELGITRERVRQIEAAALERLAVNRELDAVSDAA